MHRWNRASASASINSRPFACESMQPPKAHARAHAQLARMAPWMAMKVDQKAIAKGKAERAARKAREAKDLYN